MANKIDKNSIEAVIRNIEKGMGFKVADDDYVPALKKYEDPTEDSTITGTIPFGIKEVDDASFCGGVPRGKMVEIFGPESGGKSYLTLHLIASAQKEGLACCLVDAECSFDAAWAAQQGIDVKNLYVLDEPMYAERALDYIAALAESGKFGLIVIDSTAALVPKKELEGTMEEQDYALLARALSKGCRKIMFSCGRTGTTIIWINQIREKMGVTWGDNTTTPGGKALKFYCHQRIKVAPGEAIKVKEGDAEQVAAKMSYVTFVKNKVARPFGNCKMKIVFDKDSLNPLVKLCGLLRGSDYGIITQYKGEYRIAKEFVGEKKNLETGTYKLIDLADFLVTKGLVKQLLQSAVDIQMENNIEEEIPDDILALLEDDALIVSPKGSAKVTDLIVDKAE